MTTRELITTVSATTGMPKQQVTELLEHTVDIIRHDLLEQKTVHIQGFGDFEVRQYKERVTVNPRTGVRTLTPQKLQLNFKQNQTLKETLKNK